MIIVSGIHRTSGGTYNVTYIPYDDEAPGKFRTKAIPHQDYAKIRTVLSRMRAIISTGPTSYSFDLEKQVERGGVFNMIECDRCEKLTWYGDVVACTECNQEVCKVCHFVVPAADHPDTEFVEVCLDCFQGGVNEDGSLSEPSPAHFKEFVRDWLTENFTNAEEQPDVVAVLDALHEAHTYGQMAELVAYFQDSVYASIGILIGYLDSLQQSNEEEQS